MEILAGPSVVTLPARPTLGIRAVTPFRGMLAVRDQLMAELFGWLGERSFGPAFFRLHVVDMDGPMDVEMGVVVPVVAEGDDRVRAGSLPAGDYASLTYVNHARRANGTLIDWIGASDRRAAIAQGPLGDEFGCRYEAYMTDPRTERMKTRWQVELAILLAPK